MGSSKMSSMDVAYLIKPVVLILALAMPLECVQLGEVKDVAQITEEKVPVLIDKTSTMIRNPRIFFPPTTSTKTATTTGSVTLCMVTTTTLIACKRKRRMVLMDGEDDAEVSRIQPSLVESALDGEDDEKEEEYTDIQGDLAGHQSELSRNPRFMVYWTTIVKTSYTTTYMQTSLIATLKCTPSGFTLASSGCGR